jgi:hypothetical protein
MMGDDSDDTLILPSLEPMERCYLNLAVSFTSK